MIGAAIALRIDLVNVFGARRPRGKPAAVCDDLESANGGAIAWRFRGVAFLDAGNAFATVSQLDLAELRVGVGLGLRMKTPFALLRVDLGKPLDRRPGEPSFRWFASIGQAF